MSALKIFGFSVGPWALGIEAVEAGAVLAWPPPLARLPGAPTWLLGVMFDETKVLPVVDVAGLVDEGGDSTRDASHTLICEAGRFALPVRGSRLLDALPANRSERDANASGVPAAIASGVVRCADTTVARFDGNAVIALATRRCTSWWHAWGSDIDGNQS